MNATIAIMQPYLFPYLGYFQLAAAVEKFVFYDDVNYISGGWINRNRINLKGEPAFFTVPLVNASSSRKINEIKIIPGQHWKEKIYRTVHHAYAKAPFFSVTMRLIEGVFDCGDEFITTAAKRSIRQVANHIGLETVFIDTSAIYNNANLSGAERIIDICRMENTACYINFAGGKALYNAPQFSRHHLALKFLSPELRPPQHVSACFQPGLSVIDLLMHYDIDVIREMLRLATLENPCPVQGQAIRNNDFHAQ